MERTRINEEVILHLQSALRKIGLLYELPSGIWTHATMEAYRQFFAVVLKQDAYQHVQQPIYVDELPNHPALFGEEEPVELSVTQPPVTQPPVAIVAPPVEPPPVTLPVTEPQKSDANSDHPEGGSNEGNTSNSED